ncbi:uncharacterized protein [Amphiura filiformis]|uniref:uncharacterized protein n=1 Tax=Amphiura filiformis TaxID=82378 RepID=UPI003B21E4A8
MAMDNDGPRSFWDVDQYRRVIKRIENGYRSCDNFLTMVQERAEIEVRYAKSVRKWTEKWSGMLEKGSEFGSTLEAWRACLQEGSIVAQVHEDCKMKIMGEDGPFYNMYKWKKEHYHKGAFGSLQEAREANDGFSAAQKEYARLLTKSERAKKAYHSACVSAHKARLFAEEETHEDSVRPEFRRKLQQRAAKLAAQQEKIKQLYLKRVMKCNGPPKDRYVQEMTGEITKWQSLERARLDIIHAQLILFVRSLDCGSPYKGSGFEHLEDLYRRLEESISHADSLRDVQDWDSQYGTGCEQHWPFFQEMDIEELDAAAYADVERKTSFGNAIMQRRRQRPHHRRSQQAMYSSATDFDDEDDFSSDSFDSTSTEGESVIRNQEPLRTDHAYGQDTTHRPQHQFPSVATCTFRAQPWEYHAPTRDVEIPAQNVSAQTKIPAVGNYLHKISEHVLSPSNHSGVPAQSYQQVHVPQSTHQVHATQQVSVPQSNQYLVAHQEPGSYYSTQPAQQLSGDRSQQTVTPQRQANYVPSYQHATPASQQVTPTQLWSQVQSSNFTGVNIPSQQSPSTAAWQHQATATPQSSGSTTTAWQRQATATPPSAGSTPSTTSSQRHERHTTLNQAKQLLHLEDGEFMVRALYDFKASTRDEIPLKRGEVLVQKGKHSENGWAFGRNLEKTGIFPASYVQVVR